MKLRPAFTLIFNCLCLALAPFSVATAGSQQGQFQVTLTITDACSLDRSAITRIGQSAEDRISSESALVSSVDRVLVVEF